MIKRVGAIAQYLFDLRIGVHGHRNHILGIEHLEGRGGHDLLDDTVTSDQRLDVVGMRQKCRVDQWRFQRVGAGERQAPDAFWVQQARMHAQTMPAVQGTTVIGEHGDGQR
ncbi:hypothetical protein D3C71_1436130 [compost metagenome]